MKEEETYNKQINGNRSVLILHFAISWLSLEELSIFLYLEALKQYGFLVLVWIRNEYEMKEKI